MCSWPLEALTTPAAWPLAVIPTPPSQRATFDLLNCTPSTECNKFTCPQVYSWHFCIVVSGGGLVVFSVLLLGAEQHIAQGISLVAQIPPTSLTGIERYWEGGSRSPLRWLVVLAVGFVAGGVAGAYGASHASSSVLQWSYVAYLLGLDALLVARGARKAAEKDETVATTDLHWAALLTVGSIAGQSSGFLGIGWGPCNSCWAERCAGGSSTPGANDQSRPFTDSDDSALGLDLLATGMVVVVGCSRRRYPRSPHRYRSRCSAGTQDRSLDTSCHDGLLGFANGCTYELQSPDVMRIGVESAQSSRTGWSIMGITICRGC